MLKHVQEFKKYAEITGFRRVKIENIEEFLKTVGEEKPAGVDIQFVDAKLVATWQHLYFAVLNALTAFKNQANISKSLPMETLLYASAQRQIRKATELIGIKPTSSEIAAVIVGENCGAVKSAVSAISRRVSGELDDTVLELSEEKKATIQRAFEISEAELETVMRKDDLEKALVDLVIERMALVVTQR